VERISPEAPIPIVSLRKKEQKWRRRQFALNTVSLGAETTLLSVTGDDGMQIFYWVYCKRTYRQNIS
jgi:bifunctional ADP-heptose synthase (sugar kinase/adenylyltransferase)